MSALIRGLSATTPAMLEAFGDARLIRAALDFEAALARAEAAEGLMSEGEAAVIASVCETLEVDCEALAIAAAHAGTMAIPLVTLIREAVARRDPEAALKVHMGATSQDVADTALVLQSRQATRLIEVALDRLIAALARLASEHAETPMLGRTLLQPALPIGFGHKVANWLLGIQEAVDRLERERDAALILQFGGAVGTLHGLNGRGLAVADRLAAALGLARPASPWHARRGNLAGLGAALAILGGMLAKIARDIALMAQGEVAEAFEPRVAGRGGSSAMAGKRNPTGCQTALSAASRMPGLAATLIAGLPQEHERGLSGWQAEAPVLAELFQLAHGALAALAPVVEGLEVDVNRMDANLAAAGVGRDLGESVALARTARPDRGRS